MDTGFELFTRPPMSRQAKYAPEFLQAMEGRKFRNPETGNENVFLSLPDAEQQRIYEYWSRAKQQQSQPSPQPQQAIPEETLQSNTLVPNRDPNRYRRVKVEYGALGDDPEEIREQIHTLLGEAAKASGRTPEQMIMDLAGGGGLSGELKEVKFVPSKRGNRDTIQVFAEGDNIVEYERELVFRDGKLDHVNNVVLELDKDAPRGIGTRMLATQLAAIKEAGGKSIKTKGAGCYDCDYVGYYVWPLLGFDQKIPKTDISQMPRHLLDELDDMGGGPPYYISELMSFKEGRDWWQKNGGELDDLELKADNDVVLQRYVQEKAKKANKTVGQFLHNASKKKDTKPSENPDKVEQTPQLDQNDLQILIAIWDSLPKKRREKDDDMTKKSTTRALVDLAKNNPELRIALLEEVAKRANINWNLRDYTIDEFSQHQMLKNLREGDLIKIKFSTNENSPQQDVTRLVISDFDPSIPGVSLRGPEPDEILADRGEGMPLVWEPGGGLPAYPVLELKIVHSKLAAKVKKASTTILEHLGGQRKLASMLGARNIQELENGLSFEWPNRDLTKGNKVVITAEDNGGQTYNMTFVSRTVEGEKTLRVDPKLSADKLATAFEKATGWFLTV